MKIETANKAKRRKAALANSSATTRATMQSEWRQLCANEAEFTPAELWLAVVLVITPQAAREMFEHDTINALAIISQ